MNKRTKACQISKIVKERVFIRDGGCCVNCGRLGQPNAHYISRANGGLGIEENILTLCQECHREYDQSTLRPILREKFKSYLKSKYKNWNEERLVYKK